MEQTLLECLDCRSTFPGSENHTCRNNNNSHFASNSDVSNRNFKSVDVAIRHAHSVAGDQPVNCNFSFASPSASHALVGSSMIDDETHWCSINLHISEDTGYTNAKSQQNGYQKSELCNLQLNRDNVNFSVTNNLSENRAFILPSDPRFIEQQQGNLFHLLPPGCLVGAYPFTSDAKEDVNCSGGSDVLEPKYEFQNYNNESGRTKSNIFDNKLQSSTLFRTTTSEDYRMMAVNNFVGLCDRTNYILEPHNKDFLCFSHIPVAKRISKNLGFEPVQKGEDNNRVPKHEVLTTEAFEACGNRIKEFTYGGKLDSVNDVGSVVSSSGMNVEPEWHPENEGFICPECKKVFSRKNNLLAHYRTHTGEKPFASQKCKKRFRHKVGLTHHVLTHTGEKPFKCHTCDKRFSRKYFLTEHVRTHTGEKPYKCPICEKAFSKSSNRNTHYKNIHNTK